MTLGCYVLADRAVVQVAVIGAVLLADAAQRRRPRRFVRDRGRARVQSHRGMELLESDERDGLVDGEYVRPLAAIALRARDRTWAACLVGVLASVSYGTGLAVWPALLVMGLAHDRSTKRARHGCLPAAVVGSVTSPCGRRATNGRRRSPGRCDSCVTAQVLGGVTVRFDAPDAEWTRVRRHRRRRLGVSSPSCVPWATREAAPWLGFMVFGVGGSATVAVGRADFILGLGSNRHASLGDDAIVGTVGLVAIGVRSALGAARGGPASGGRRWPRRRAVIGVVVAVTVSSPFDLERIECRGPAGRVRVNGVISASLAAPVTSWAGSRTVPDGIERLLESSGHVPFEGGSRFDCGHAGDRLDFDELDRSLPDGVRVMLIPGSRQVERAFQTSGWIDDPGGQIGCILVLDAAGDVVGAGTIGPVGEGYGPGRGLSRIRPDDYGSGFVMVRPVGTFDAAIVLVLDARPVGGHPFGSGGTSGARTSCRLSDHSRAGGRWRCHRSPGSAAPSSTSQAGRRVGRPLAVTIP